MIVMSLILQLDASKLDRRTEILSSLGYEIVVEGEYDPSSWFTTYGDVEVGDRAVGVGLGHRAVLLVG